MSNNTKPKLAKTIAICLGVITTVVVLFVYQVLQPVYVSKIDMQRARVVVFDEPRALPKLTLTKIDGSEFAADDLKGQWDLLYFGFTACPDVCPTALSKMQRISAKLEEVDGKDEWRYWMVSVDPERDTPEVLSAYVSHFDPDFKGLTGTVETVFEFARAVNMIFAKVKLDDSEMNYTIDHSDMLVMVDPDGLYRGFIKPPYDVSVLAKIMRSLNAYGVKN